MSFEVLPHPADVRFRTRGATRDEAFGEVVRAFATINESSGGTEHRFPVDIESEDHEALLFDFLARLIFLSEVEECALDHAEDLTIEDTTGGHHLTATLVAGDIEDLLFDIKSPTYNGMRVERDADGWVIEATLDI